MAEIEKEEKIQFEWGRKRGVGGKKKDVQFYESFTYDGVEYTLFDSVYMYVEGEPEPHVGKLIKIWENPDKTKKVKVLWFFRPCEILNFLEASVTRDNELFLASGEGVGLANVNPLEAIAGKCNVVCICKDSRNPQPSIGKLQMAEFVFYRFFDVGHCKVVDSIDDKIAGTEVKYMFNKLDSSNPAGVVKPDLDKKEVSGNDMASKEVVAPSGQKTSQSIIEKANDQSIDTLVRGNADSKPYLEEKPSSTVGIEEASKSNNEQQTVINDETTPQAKVKEDGVSKTSLVKQKSSSGQSYASRSGLDLGEMAKRNDSQDKVSNEKTTLRSKVDSKEGVARGPIRQVEVEGDVKFTEDNVGLVEGKQSKKTSLGGSNKIFNEKNKTNLQSQKLVCDDGDNDDDVKSPSVISSKDRYKLQRARDSSNVEPVSSKKLKLDKKPTILTHGKLQKESSTDSAVVESKLDCRAVEVTRRPDADKSKWFKGFPWEERMKTAHKQGTLVLLQNLDPSITSQEVEDMIWHGFKESCTAKMIQATAFSSPYSGQAFVIFKKKEAAEAIIEKLDQGCFLMSNKHPLVGSIGNPCFSEKKPVFYGHLPLDQLRIQMREMKDAVSTSHCSQPNNIEYDMAMEWCLLQEREDLTWKRLYQRQGEELKKLMAKLKSK